MRRYYRYPDYYSPACEPKLGCGLILLRIAALAMVILLIRWAYEAL
jgi:hypothetical protein